MGGRCTAEEGAEEEAAVAAVAAKARGGGAAVVCGETGAVRPRGHAVAEEAEEESEEAERTEARILGHGHHTCLAPHRTLCRARRAAPASRVVEARRAAP